MKPTTRSTGVMVCFSLLALITPARASEPTIDDVAVNAYLYFYPLLTMDLTRLQATNIAPGKQFLRGPTNMFSNAPAFPPAVFKVVVRPNFDVLYSSAFLDMTKEPVIISVPETNGRYYMLPMLDMWTDVFASPGWRTTGTSAQDFLIVPMGWNGVAPSGVTWVEAPTPTVWIIGRTKTDGPADYVAVNKIQAGFKITPLSQWGKPVTPVEVTVDPNIDMKTTPKIQVEMMEGKRYFAYAAELLKSVRPHPTDEPIIEQMRRHLGIERGRSLDLDALDPAVKKALELAPKAAQQLMAWKARSMGARREWLVDEYGYNGCLRQQLLEAGASRAIRPWRQSSGGRHLSAQSRRQRGQGAGRSEQLHNPLREKSDPAGRCILVRDAL
jgi:hypothetical protein